MPERVLVALGSNLGDRAAYLAAARNAMSLLGGSRLLVTSSIEETAALGAMAQPPYLNQVVALETTVEPHAMLAALQRIERGLGRVRGARWGARTIDLDIICFGDRAVSSVTLELPHPGLASRPFWQRGIAELVRAGAATA